MARPSITHSLVAWCLALRGAVALQPSRNVLRSARATAEHPWATKNGGANHSGYSPHVVTADLSQPSWEVKLPGIIHNTPVIDRDLNVYLTHTSGKVLSLDKNGNERWRFQTAGKYPGNPALLGDAIFVCSDSGVVHALELASGAERWRKKIGYNCPGDAWVSVAVGTTLIQPANVDTANTGGNCDVVALSTLDGSTKWKFNLCPAGPPGYNMMAAVVDSAVVFQDSHGGVYRLDLESGKRAWLLPGHKETMTTGGMAVGPDGVIYSAANYQGYCDKGKGMLRAVDLRSGTVLWQRTFDQGINAAPAVGPLGKDGQLAVVVNEANNFLEFGIPASFLLAASLYPPPVHRGSVFALAAHDGSTIWSYEVDGYKSWLYPQQKDGCLPDAFANPAIGGDGTVYINWSGGYAYAIRDGQKVSSFRTATGMNGESAIAPGLLVVPSCNSFRGYLS